MATFTFEDMFGDVNDTTSDPAVNSMPINQEEIEVVEEGKDFHEGGEHPIIVLCLDTSFSMSLKDSASGKSRIDLVKEYARDFINTTAIADVDKERVELCVITFDTKVTIIKDFAPMTEVSDDFDYLEAKGLTCTYSALVVAVNAARKRRNELLNTGTPCFKPIIFMVTDGRPEGDDEMRDGCKKLLARYVDKGEDGKAKMRLVICGMKDCDMKEMNALCQDKQLIGLADTDALDDAFKLLTASVAAVSSSTVSDNDISLTFENAAKLVTPAGQGKKLTLD